MMTVSGFVPTTGVVIVSFLVPTSTLGVVTVCVSRPTVGVLTWYVSSPVFLHATSGSVRIAAPIINLRMWGPPWVARSTAHQGNLRAKGPVRQSFSGERGASRERLLAGVCGCGGAR